jgi:hypothetical protein
MKGVSYPRYATSFWIAEHLSIAMGLQLYILYTAFELWRLSAAK